MNMRIRLQYNTFQVIFRVEIRLLKILREVLVDVFNPSYLVSVRILSVSSVSHLFHAIKRQSQADEDQQADTERRHDACDS